jgi:lactoylglutathione lyase
MIKGLFETHLFVEDLDRSIDFYKNALGLEPCYFEKERRIAFFWVGKPKEAMLGLWEKPKEEIDIRHFAFRCDSGEVLYRAAGFLKQRNLTPYNFLKTVRKDPWSLPGCRR